MGEMGMNLDSKWELLDSIAEEIGEENVIQVVTDGACDLMAAERMLMEKRTKLFWSPCAAHCLDLGRELTRPIVTRFATSYLTLNCIKQQKNALRSMFASEEWATSSHASKSEAKQVMNLVLSDGRFWKSITYCL
ncbi:hypothetical protein CR513_18333, partial [Mucuna pruriens]